MKKPLNKPIPAPIKTIIKIARTGLNDNPEVSPDGTISHAAIIAQNPRVDSTERSKFPVKSTIDSAITRIPKPVADRRMFLKFIIEKNLGTVNEKIRQLKSNNIQIMLSKTNFSK
jgi:hypothetical protein